MNELNVHGKPHVFEYSKITNQLYIGTNLCCQDHFKEELLDKGITSDISLEEEHIDMPYGVESFVWLPVKDHDAPTMDQLELGVSVIKKTIDLKKKVYVHCKNGHGRAPTLVAAYLIRYEGKTPLSALEYLKKKRPEIHLEEVQIKKLEKFNEMQR